MVKRENIAILLTFLYAVVLVVEISKGFYWVFPPESKKALYCLQYIADAAMILLQLITFSVWELIERYYLMKKENIERACKILRSLVIFLGILFPAHLLFCMFFKNVRVSEMFFLAETVPSLIFFSYIHSLMKEKPIFILFVIPCFFFLRPQDIPIFILIPFSFYICKALNLIPIRDYKMFLTICGINIVVAIVNRLAGATMWLCFAIYAVIKNIKMLPFRSPTNLMLCLYAIPCAIPIIFMKDPIMDWGTFATVFLTFLFVTMYSYFIGLGSRGVLRVKRNPMILYRFLWMILPLAYFVGITPIYPQFRAPSMVLTMILGVISIILAFRLFI